MKLSQSRKDVFPHEQRTQSAASSRMPQTGRPGAKRCREHLGAHFLIVPFSSTVPSSIPYFLMTLRSWSMSNSSVASLPANIMMDFFPPGCSPESHPSWSTLVQNWCKTCNFDESLRVLMYASRPTSLSNQTRSMWQQFGKIRLSNKGMRTRWHVSSYISLQCFTLSAHIVQQGKIESTAKEQKDTKDEN